MPDNDFKPTGIENWTNVFETPTQDLPSFGQQLGMSLKEWAGYFGQGVQGFDSDEFVKKFGQWFNAYDPSDENYRRDAFGAERRDIGNQYVSAKGGQQQKAAGGFASTGIGREKMNTLREAFGSSVGSALARQDTDIRGFQKEWLAGIFDTMGGLSDLGAFDPETYNQFGAGNHPGGSFTTFGSGTGLG